MTCCLKCLFVVLIFFSYWNINQLAKGSLLFAPCYLKLLLWWYCLKCLFVVLIFEISINWQRDCYCLFLVRIRRFTMLLWWYLISWFVWSCNFVMCPWIQMFSKGKNHKKSNKKFWEWIFENLFPTLKYKKYLIWPIKYSKHYKSTQYMKRTTLSTNMIGNEKHKMWQKNTIFTGKMLKVLFRC